MNHRSLAPRQPAPHHRRRSGRGAFAPLIASAMLALTGCQTYQPSPLDLDATRAAWLDRSPTDASVREFAAALELAERSGTLEPTPFDPSDGLTLAEAEAVALAFNPDLRQARLEANVTRATAAHAGLWQDPMLGADMEHIFSGAGGDNPWVVGSTLALTVPISGRLQAEKQRAGAELASELDRLVAREWATRAALRELWIEWSAACMHAELSADLIARLRDVAALADLQEQAGSMTRIDARLFRVQLAGREADQIAAVARARELELHLRSMLGIAPETPLTLVPTVALAPRAARPEDLQTLLDASNPELSAVRAAYEASEQSLRVEVRKQYPDLTIGPGFGTDQGDSRVLLGVSLPIPLWNRNRQGIAEASAAREVARGRFETTYERLASQLAIALTRYDAGKEQRRIIEATVLPLADEQEADVRRVATIGRIDPLMLLQSLETLHDAKVRLLDARAAESTGAARLDELIGPAAPTSQTPIDSTHH